MSNIQLRPGNTVLPFLARAWASARRKDDAVDKLAVKRAITRHSRLGLG